MSIISWRTHAKEHPFSSHMLINWSKILHPPQTENFLFQHSIAIANGKLTFEI